MLKKLKHWLLVRKVHKQIAKGKVIFYSIHDINKLTKKKHGHFEKGVKNG